MITQFTDSAGTLWEVPVDMLRNEEGRTMLHDEVEAYFGPLTPVTETEES